jgi:hypothetical protein
MPTIQISIMPDLMPVDAYDDNSCPLATRDSDVNEENKAEAVENADYRDPSESGAFRISDVCGSCRHYDQTEETLDCIGDDSGDLGYCLMYRFVCAADHTCDDWSEGGPMTASSQQSYRDNL